MPVLPSKRLVFPDIPTWISTLYLFLTKIKDKKKPSDLTEGFLFVESFQ